MKRATLIANSEDRFSIAMIGLISIVIIGLMLIPFPSSSPNAQQPAPKGCFAVSKIQYASAKKENLLRTSFAAYARTGLLFHHYYWYCH